jgi:hypothetical protein
MPVRGKLKKFYVWISVHSSFNTVSRYAFLHTARHKNMQGLCAIPNSYLTVYM